jgi:hypothetical protein
MGIIEERRKESRERLGLTDEFFGREIGPFIECHCSS